MSASEPVLLRLERLPSTQELVHELAAEGAPYGTAVVAGEQTAGRGSRGRVWHSPQGGLWLSVLCRPAGEAAAEVMSLRVALAVAPAIELVAPGVRLGIKWPNDLLLGGLKAGGILCEARWQGGTLGWIAVGLGLNVSNPVPEELAGLATTLSIHTPGLRPENLVEPLVAAIAEAGQRAGGLTPEERKAFRERDVLFGKPVSTPVAGVADGISGRGELRVLVPGGAVSLVRTGIVTA